MKRKFTLSILSLLVLLMAFTGFSFALDGNDELLTIKGDGVSKEITFTGAELEAMTKGITQNIYSTTNSFPTDKVMYRKGISLTYLLESAGIKDTAQQFKFISTDGYSKSFTRAELLEDERYYFSSTGSKAVVPTIIAFKDSATGFNSMSDIEMALTMGQRVKGEQNNPWFVKYLRTIEVSTADPGQWSPVTFTKTQGPNGISVKLQHPNFDSVKIYYTTDGTTPTINSKLYNISASYFQPELNKPIIVTKDNTKIQAIAIGAGKADSTVASTVVTYDGPVFNDLGNYPWAKPAIESLTKKGIINGMGGSRFAPGEPLTRAQFATMMVLALGETPAKTSVAPFSDVKPTDWHCGYVKKAVEMGLVHGYTDGTFRPNRALTREEMFTMVVQAMGVKVDTGAVDAAILAPFSTETRISDWARGYVAYAEKLGLLEHGHMAIENGNKLSFDARKQAIRAEAAETVYRMVTVKGK
ncbi:MAG: S-layer homology domain-containing protein [Anaerovoracaceae bacterium]